MNVVKYERLSTNASIPTKSTPNAAGYNLCAAVNATVPRYNSCLIMTDLSFKMPPGVYGRLTSRPGISVMYNIFVGAEVIGKKKIVVLFIVNNYFFSYRSR